MKVHSSFVLLDLDEVPQASLDLLRPPLHTSGNLAPESLGVSGPTFTLLANLLINLEQQWVIFCIPGATLIF